MQLCRFLAVDGDSPRVGLIRDGHVHDVETGGGPAMLGEALSMPVAELRAALEAIDVPGAPLEEVTLLAPIDEQETATGRMPSSSSASMTGICDRPRAPPPPKAMATEGSPERPALSKPALSKSGRASLVIIPHPLSWAGNGRNACGCLRKHAARAG